MKSVFIVTHRQGFESDPVIDLLRKDGIQVFRFNGDDKEAASQISIEINGGGVDISFTCDGHKIRKNEIGVGWCQQLPPYLSQASSVEECLQRRNFWAAQISAFEMLGEIPWLNAPQNVLSASSKPRQLWKARSVGLNIPATLISNTPNDIHTLASEKSIIAKNLSTPWIVLDNQEVKAAYSQIVQSDWLKNDKELEFCPIIYQEYCKRRKDYRVIVVGDQVFSVCCKPTKDQKEDVRLASSTGESYHRCDFDPQVLDKLRLLMKELSIEYCGADFMENDDGQLRFLEVNTCGAWWWADRLYDGRICKAIVSYLKKNLH